MDERVCGAEIRATQLPCEVNDVINMSGTSCCSGGEENLLLMHNTQQDAQNWSTRSITQPIMTLLSPQSDGQVCTKQFQCQCHFKLRRVCLQFEAIQSLRAASSVLLMTDLSLMHHLPYLYLNISWLVTPHHFCMLTACELQRKYFIKTCMKKSKWGGNHVWMSGSNEIEARAR